MRFTEYGTVYRLHNDNLYDIYSETINIYALIDMAEKIQAIIQRIYIHIYYVSIKIIVMIYFLATTY